MTSSSARVEKPAPAHAQPEAGPSNGPARSFPEEIGVTALHMEHRLHQLSTQVRQRDGLLNTISAFTRDLLTQPSQPQLVQAVLEKACQLLDTEHAFVDLLTPEGDAMVDLCAFGVFNNTEPTRIVRGEGMVGRVWDSGQPVMINDFMNWDGRSPKSDGLSIRAIIGAPLKFNHQIIGVIGLAHTDATKTFSLEQLMLLSRFAEIAAAAVHQQQQQQRTRQESDRAVQQVLTREQSLLRVRDSLTSQIADRNARLHRQNAVLSALHETTLSLLGETDGASLLLSVLEHAKGTLNATYGFVSVVSADGQSIADISGDAADIGVRRSSARGEGLRGHIWQTGRAEIIADYQDWPGRAPDAELDALHAMMAAPLKSDGEVIGVIGMSHNDPALHFSQDDLEVLSRFAELASLVYDRARLLQSERRNRRVAESLRDVLKVMNSTRSASEVLDFILQQAVQLLDVQRGILFRLNPHTHELTILAASGVTTPSISQFAIVVPPGTLARARRYLRSGLVLPSSVLNILVAGIRKNPALRDEFASLTDDMGSAITAQLSVDGDTFGGMMLFDVTPRVFSAEDNQVMQSLAMHASLAIENARLRVQAVAAAAEEERSRLARELHDSVSQALFGISLGMNTALQVVDSDPAAVKHPLNYALTLAQAAIAEMRALIFQLRPDLLEQHGLCGVIQTQADALRARNQLAVEIEGCNEEPRLPFEIKEAMYRVITEALHNIVKHAHATRVRLILNTGKNGTNVQIVDNGVGFEPGQHFPTRFGLRVMRERMEHLGGIVTVESAPNQGTAVQIHVPAIHERVA
jgi:signal transduction histidine kinase